LELNIDSFDFLSRLLNKSGVGLGGFGVRANFIGAPPKFEF